MNQDYYVILGVETNATPQQIRAAYRQRALELHPDLSGSDAERFLAVQEAYRVLSDPGARELYDSRTRAKAAVAPAVEPLRVRAARPEPEPMQEPGRRPRRVSVSLTDSFETYAPSFDELFDRFWGNFSSLSRPKSESLESLTVEIPVSPEAAARGGSVEVLIPARAECPTCQGHGAAAGYECWRCAGHGAITVEYPVDVAFPSGIVNEHLVQLPLHTFGIENFYLTLRFRVSGSAP